MAATVVSCCVCVCVCAQHIVCGEKDDCDSNEVARQRQSKGVKVHSEKPFLKEERRAALGGIQTTNSSFEESPTTYYTQFASCTRFSTSTVWYMYTSPYSRIEIEPHGTARVLYSGLHVTHNFPHPVTCTSVTSVPFHSTSINSVQWNLKQGTLWGQRFSPCRDVVPISEVKCISMGLKQVSFVEGSSLPQRYK